jgi:hypothetical protein
MMILTHTTSIGTSGFPTSLKVLTVIILEGQDLSPAAPSPAPPRKPHLPQTPKTTCDATLPPQLLRDYDQV